MGKEGLVISNWYARGDTQRGASSKVIERLSQEKKRKVQGGNDKEKERWQNFKGNRAASWRKRLELKE